MMPMYWMQKKWALVAMKVFAPLYILQPRKFAHPNTVNEFCIRRPFILTA